MFDYLGVCSFAGFIVALLLGLQFGGSSYSWSDRRTIACLSVASVLSISFAIIEWRRGNNALVPMNIISNKVVNLSPFYNFMLDGAYFVLTYQVSYPPVMRLLFY